jgi:hypothetical protein
MPNRLLPLILLALSCGDKDDPCDVEWFTDADGDGFGDPETGSVRCPADGLVEVGTDCDDTNAAAFPGATPVCDDSTDDDCDGAIDANEVDGDADGATACTGDCDDTTETRSPTAPELCNDVDDDCDGIADLDDRDLVNGIACGQCPDPADLEADVAAGVMTFATYNPCVLDPATVSLCHRDDPDNVQTHTNGERLHRVAHRTDQPLREELLLYFPPGPGTNNDQLLQWMAHTGYRLVSLGWTNENSVLGPDFEPYDAFFEQMRGELTYGEDLSPDVEVGPADAIVGRLTTLLDFLAVEEPTMGWEQYRDTTQTGAAGIRWDRIVVTGWSEGASEAGWLARDQLFDGVVLLSGPTDVGGAIDGVPKLPPAPWVYDTPRVTPSCRHFEFYHQLELEPNHDYDVLLLSLEALDILHPPDLGVDTDASLPPYPDTRVINTGKSDFNEGFGCSYHQAMAMDQCMSEELVVPYHWLYCTAGVPTDECP